MLCDRAQEFFSDYLERTLDRPMMVAMEAHLAGCAACREEVEVLRDTVFLLDSAPEVEPPADGAWKVMCAIQRVRAEQIEAERQRTPSFLDWLRGLRPANVAMVSGLGTLVVAGALLGPLSPFHVQNNPLDLGNRNASVQAPERPLPPLSVQEGPATNGGRQFTLQLVPDRVLARPHVQVTSSAGRTTFDFQGDLQPRMPAGLTVNVPLAAAAQVLHVEVEAPPGQKVRQFDVVVPLQPAPAQRTSLFATEQPLAEVLRQLAPSLGRPVVIEGDAQQSVSLQAEEQAPASCLATLAAKSRLNLVPENGFFRLVPMP